MVARSQLSACGDRWKRGKLFEDAVETGGQILAAARRNLQRVPQVRDEVVGVLDADGEADEVVRERALLGGDGGVAHGAGHLAEAVYAAEGDRHLENPTSLEEAPRELHVACREADHGALAPALRAVDLEALRAAASAAWEEDLLDLGMLQQELADLCSALLGALHSQVHGLDAAEEQEALEGRERRALSVLQKGDTVCQTGVADTHKATGTIGMA
mmetsp:Transcript_124883/g.388761  ORF Transcript_124883/g.388761 Transcript_124883/m.388761 type:complete len:216 (-) Transcript_124883:1090-1737(-)